MLRSNQTILPLILIGSLLSATSLCAAERERLAVNAATDAADAFEMFSAIDSGVISAKFIPMNAADANVILQNNTNRVLRIQLPDAFAAVPVLAQFGQNPAGGQQQGGGGASQGVGGGMNQGNGMGLGNGMQGGNGRQAGGGERQGFGLGFMRIAPQKSRKLKATTVCLEYGKPEPNPRIKYQMIPIEQFTSDTRLAKLCKQVGNGSVAQDTAQAAAWHLNSGLSWDRLAKINRIESRYLGNIKFFNARELTAAKDLVESFKRDDLQPTPLTH